MREELLRRLDSRLKQLAASDKVLDEISMLTLDQQVELFRETFDPHDESQVREVAQQYVDLRFADARRAVENDDWLRIDRIGMRLLGVENLVPVEWLYLKMALTGLGNADAKYVMIDEVQDYTVPSWPCWRATSSARTSCCWAIRTRPSPRAPPRSTRCARCSGRCAARWRSAAS